MLDFMSWRLMFKPNSVLNAGIIPARARWKPPKLKEEEEEAAHIPSNKVRWSCFIKLFFVLQTERDRALCTCTNCKWKNVDLTVNIQCLVFIMDIFNYWLLHRVFIHSCKNSYVYWKLKGPLALDSVSTGDSYQCKLGVTKTQVFCHHE